MEVQPWPFSVFLCFSASVPDSAMPLIMKNHRFRSAPDCCAHPPEAPQLYLAFGPGCCRPVAKGVGGNEKSVKSTVNRLRWKTTGACFLSLILGACGKQVAFRQRKRMTEGAIVETAVCGEMRRLFCRQKSTTAIFPESI